MNLSTFGTILILASGLASLLTALSGIGGYFRKSPPLELWAKRGLTITLLLTLLTSILLWIALLGDRFDLRYVAYNSSKATPWFYKLSAFWGSLDGSLILWALFLVIFSSLFMLPIPTDRFPPISLAIAVPGVILSFFFFTTLATANPFSRLVDEAGTPFTPPDGLGLNPLLQHPAMVLHPPFLYLGFTGFTIPFALALSALIHDPLDDRWLRLCRRSTLLAFGFLSIGILMGSNWAYMELGWGGYWGWDPVENSSLLPWLSGTAFLHSVIIQEYRGFLRGWNFFLIFLTFWLTLLGTFLTRSGVVSSVHAFAEGEVGIWFASFLTFSVLTSLGILLYRLPRLRARGSSLPYLSREGMFLLNNLLFLALAFSILWGTTFPILNEILTGQKITIGTPYYEKVTYPFGLLLLILLGIGPLMPWGGAQANRILRRFRLPLFAGVAGGIVPILFGIKKPQALVFSSFLSFTFVATIVELVKGWVLLAKREGLGYLKGARALFSRNSRRYGGYLVHLGITLIFLGVSGGFYRQEAEFRLRPGEEIAFQGYRFHLDRFESREFENYLTRMAVLRVTTPEGKEFKMWPEKRTYLDGRREKTSEVAIVSTTLEDLYLALLEDLPGGGGIFRFHINPLVFWVWAGGVVVILGTLFTLLGRAPSRLEEDLPWKT